MRSYVYDILPAAVRRSLTKFGSDFSIARRKRRFTTASMAERLGVSRATYARIEKGDPTVAMGAYAQALFVLGFGSILGDLIDQSYDDQGLLLDLDRLPKRGLSPKKDSGAVPRLSSPQIKGLPSINNLQDQAKEVGTDAMGITLDEINAEIAAVRKKRRARRP